MKKPAIKLKTLVLLVVCIIATMLMIAPVSAEIWMEKFSGTGEINNQIIYYEDGTFERFSGSSEYKSIIGFTDDPYLRIWKIVDHRDRS